MHIFEEINENLFRPLTGCNKRMYADILSLIWDMCRRMPMYAIEKSTVVEEVTDYFRGFGKIDEIDFMEEIDPQTDYRPEQRLREITEPRAMANAFLRRLKKTGWIEEKDGSYDEEPEIAVNYKIIPVLGAFREIVNPKIMTYKGKLYKVFALLNRIEEQKNPYESVLKEVVEDMDELNDSLRNLAASIEDYMEKLMEGKTPQEILELFGNYEERIVVGSYHSFKTNDNLFYYRANMYEQLDACEEKYWDAIVQDCMQAEQLDKNKAEQKAEKVIQRMREALLNMEKIMRTIDDRHITYRTRAVQRAQFLLLSDGSVKNKINALLQFYSNKIKEKEMLYETDDTPAKDTFQIYAQHCYQCDSLYTPKRARQVTEISEMEDLAFLDPSCMEEARKQLEQYAAKALTSENINEYVKNHFEKEKKISELELTKEDMIRVIGIYTYSRANDRIYDIELTNEVITRNGLRFTDFVVKRRKEEIE